MGLYVHSLDRLPDGLARDYYIYVLDYGWDEPLGAALHQNFRRMADLAAQRKTVVVASTDSRRLRRTSSQYTLMIRSFHLRPSMERTERQCCRR